MYRCFKMANKNLFEEKNNPQKKQTSSFKTISWKNSFAIYSRFKCEKLCIFNKIII